ncbi:Desert hedgehog protein, partial [Frankliniella fusca]
MNRCGFGFTVYHHLPPSPILSLPLFLFFSTFLPFFFSFLPLFSSFPPLFFLFSPLHLSLAPNPPLLCLVLFSRSSAPE